MSETEVKLENGRIVISDELRGKLMEATGWVVNVDEALRELSNVFKTGGESMKVFAEELKKLADKRDKLKIKPAKPYWRTGDRW